MSRRAARIIVHGLVQGVGFRYFCRRLAVRMGLVGFTRNRPDSTVEVWAEGEFDTLEQFIAELRIGPSSAKVQSIETMFGECTQSYTTFEITP